MLSKKTSRSYKQEDGDKKTFAKNSYVFLFSTRVSLSREASFLMKLTESVCRNRKKKKTGKTRETNAHALRLLTASLNRTFVLDNNSDKGRISSLSSVPELKRVCVIYTTQLCLLSRKVTKG